jgi:hypothetical protein
MQRLSRSESLSVAKLQPLRDRFDKILEGFCVTAGYGVEIEKTVNKLIKLHNNNFKAAYKHMLSGVLPCKRDTLKITSVKQITTVDKFS